MTQAKQFAVQPIHGFREVRSEMAASEWLAIVVLMLLIVLLCLGFRSLSQGRKTKIVIRSKFGEASFEADEPPAWIKPNKRKRRKQR
ncbi:hypothetical protein [Fimbriiglobus ruber]|uniref:hypothetical protein n=1 Tax=Fimbriiglobus ruber TaxID=1908690 RepID=UPI0011799605|nr:hypothetical protein [Fimbriiglobus ruber]